MDHNDSPGSPKRLNPTRIPKFCPICGAPMTDEAVEMVMERWEELTMARAIDGELLELEIANIANKLAKSDAQKALMGRVMYYVEHMPTLTPPNEPLTCEGCAEDGKWEWEYQNGAECPCTYCKRRAADCYRRPPEETA